MALIWSQGGFLRAFSCIGEADGAREVASVGDVYISQEGAGQVIAADAAVEGALSALTGWILQAGTVRPVMNELSVKPCIRPVGILELTMLLASLLDHNRLDFLEYVSRDDLEADRAKRGDRSFYGSPWRYDITWNSAVYLLNTYHF